MSEHLNTIKSQSATADKIAHTPDEFHARNKRAMAVNVFGQTWREGVLTELMKAEAQRDELLQIIKDIHYNALVMCQAEPNSVWIAVEDQCRAAIAKAEGK